MVFQEGDTAYIIVNNLYVKPCTIVSTSGDMCVISFRNGGAIRVRKSRLYHTAEETGKPFAGIVKTPDEVVGSSKRKKKEELLPWDWV